jgi:tRNA A37 threonylcarbamoyladenosine biosynthesis protein TsaE
MARHLKGERPMNHPLKQPTFTPYFFNKKQSSYHVVMLGKIGAGKSSLVEKIAQGYRGANEQ